MAWMDVVNLHPLLTLFTIVIPLAGLFFLYPVVSFSCSNNVMPSPPPLGRETGSPTSCLPYIVFTIVILLAGLFFLFPVVHFS